MRWLIRGCALLMFAIPLTVMAQMGGDSEQETRPFRLGFTTFPYAVSYEAVNFTYEHIEEDADLIAQHYDNGVPWTEALANTRYADNVMNDWGFHRPLTPDGLERLVSITPISFARDGLALYRGDANDMPLPAPFDSYTFDHPDVEAAFYQYAETTISYWQPDYLCIGIEVNLLQKLRPDLWDSYLTLHRNIYTRLKAAHPDLTIFVSMTGIDLVEGYTDVDHAGQMQAFEDIIGYTDILAFSVYPYMTEYMTAMLPPNLLDEMAALGIAANKPMAVSETGYPAQAFGIEANGLRLEFNGTPELQQAWTEQLLEKAAEYDFRFIVNFVLRDYDELWQAIGGREDLTIAWRDTGLYAEDGTPRPALDTWREWLTQPYMPPS